MRRARIILIAALLSAPSWAADEKLGLEVEASIGPSWPSLTGLCNVEGCAVPPTVALRVGYELVPFASVGLRGAAALGPQGRDFCPGPTLCDGSYRAWSILVDGRLHTVGTTQLTFGAAFGLTRLISLQCQCEEVYQATGSKLPTLEFALGGRTYLPGLPIHVGLEARYSAIFGAESGYATEFGPPGRVSERLVVSSIAVSFVVGTSL
jgi:hypothetical protein